MRMELNDFVQTQLKINFVSSLHHIKRENPSAEALITNYGGIKMVF